MSEERDEAKERLEEAENLMDDGYVGPAIHSAYYAAFHAAMGLLALEGVRPKTHAGVLAEIYKRLVLPGRLDKETGALLEDAFEMRLQADYGVVERPSREDSEQALRDARAFVEAARRLVQPQG